MTVLITRLLAFAKRTEQVLQAKGLDTWLDPVLTIQSIPIEFDETAYDAFITTSMVAIELLATGVSKRDMPLFCAGKASGVFARERGFTQVFYPEHSGGKELISIIQQSAYTRFAYLHGETVKVNIAAELYVHKNANNVNMETDAFCAYRTIPAMTFSDETLTKFKNRTISAITFYSEYSAEVILDLMHKHELLSALPKITALCISDAVADKIKSFKWKAVEIL